MEWTPSRAESGGQPSSRGRGRLPGSCESACGSPTGGIPRHTTAVWARSLLALSSDKLASCLSYAFTRGATAPVAAEAATVAMAGGGRVNAASAVATPVLPSTRKAMWCRRHEPRPAAATSLSYWRRSSAEERLWRPAGTAQKSASASDQSASSRCAAKAANGTCAPAMRRSQCSTRRQRDASDESAVAVPPYRSAAATSAGSTATSQRTLASARMGPTMSRLRPCGTAPRPTPPMGAAPARRQW